MSGRCGSACLLRAPRSDVPGPWPAIDAGVTRRSQPFPDDLQHHADQGIQKDRGHERVQDLTPHAPSVSGGTDPGSPNRAPCGMSGRSPRSSAPTWSSFVQWTTWRNLNRGEYPASYDSWPR
jgi:hypothetical protein